MEGHEDADEIWRKVLASKWSNGEGGEESGASLVSACHGGEQHCGERPNTEFGPVRK